MAMINFDVVPELVENVGVMNSVSSQGFLEVMMKLGGVLKSTEQEEPLIEEIIGLTKVVEDHFNALLLASRTHHTDLMSITEIAEALRKRETGVTMQQAEEIGVKLTARADAIRNL